LTAPLDGLRQRLLGGLIQADTLGPCQRLGVSRQLVVESARFARSLACIYLGAALGQLGRDDTLALVLELVRSALQEQHPPAAGG